VHGAAAAAGWPLPRPGKGLPRRGCARAVEGASPWRCKGKGQDGLGVSNREQGVAQGIAALTTGTARGNGVGLAIRLWMTLNAVGGPHLCGQGSRHG
jgi:hypothetical protein